MLDKPSPSWGLERVPPARLQSFTSTNCFVASLLCPFSLLSCLFSIILVALETATDAAVAPLEEIDSVDLLFPCESIDLLFLLGLKF